MFRGVSIKNNNVKTKISPRIIFVLLLFIILSSAGFAQRSFELHKSGSIWRNWYIKGGVNLNAMFGDITSYDQDPFQKIGQESRFGFQVTAGKWVTDWGGAELTYSRGNLYGSRSDLEVNTNFNQYMICGIVNITQLIYPSDVQTPFYVYGKIGYGQIDFNAVLTNVNTGDTIRMQGVETAHDKRVSEWLLPFGLAGVYNFDKNFSLVAEVTYFHVNTDKLDGKYISSSVDFNDNKDSYATFSLGVQYTFNISNRNASYHKMKTRKSRRFVH